MLKESAEITKISEGAIWVRATQKTACGSCSAEKGCGQSVLAEWAAKRTLLKVDLDNQNSRTFSLGEMVTIGIPEDVVVGGSLVLYFLPLATLLVGAMVGYNVFGSDGATAIVAFLGLICGGFFAAKLTSLSHAKGIHPVLLTGLEN